jgi:hypothetical protein
MYYLGSMRPIWLPGATPPPLASVMGVPACEVTDWRSSGLPCMEPAVRGASIGGFIGEAACPLNAPGALLPVPAGMDG